MPNVLEKFNAWKSMLDAKAQQAEAENNALLESRGVPPGVAGYIPQMGMMTGTVKPKFRPYELQVNLKEPPGSWVPEGTKPIDDYDAMLGLNRGHALWRAKQNWPGLDVTPVGQMLSPRPYKNFKWEK